MKEREVIPNAGHEFVFLDGSGNLGRCRLCKMIVTYPEAKRRPFRQCSGVPIKSGLLIT